MRCIGPQFAGHCPAVGGDEGPKVGHVFISKAAKAEMKAFEKFGFGRHNIKHGQRQFFPAFYGFADPVVPAYDGNFVDFGGFLKHIFFSCLTGQAMGHVIGQVRFGGRSSRFEQFFRLKNLQENFVNFIKIN